MNNSLEIVSVVGARPQFVKLAPVSRAFEKSAVITHRVIHTGQHYDDRMSAVFFEELSLPRPEIDLGIGSAGHGAQTGAMLAKLEDVFLQQKPDAVVVFGDTNSTLAAALAATKIHIPVAHIEAGLRSFNRKMPEELNRVATDHVSDRLYAPTPTAIKNLKDENLGPRALLTGDVMRDVVMHNSRLAAQRSQILKDLNIDPGKYGLLTLHRPVNTTPEALQELLTLLDEMAKHHIQLIFPIHPRTQSVLNSTGIKPPESVRLIPPVPYLDMLNLVDSAKMVITDSGGLQKEAAFLRTRCITLREETEWTETVDLGINTLTGRDTVTVRNAFSAAMNKPDPFTDHVMNELDQQFGIGDAATIITDDLISWLSNGAA